MKLLVKEKITRGEGLGVEKQKGPSETSEKVLN